jgi:ATP-binding cassette subfamily C protein CydCD
VGLGASAWLAGVTLTAAAAWLLVRAASLPAVLTLSAAVVTVRGSAVARPLLRYLERLASHEVGFARLGTWRAQVYSDLIPRTPGAGLRRRGELLSRIVADVDLRVDGLLRGRLPAASALVALVVTVAAAALVLPVTAVVLVPALLVGAVAAPMLAARQASRLEDDSAQARAELADAMVETVDGIEELAGRGQAALRIPVQRGQALARIEASAARSAGAAAAIAHLAMGFAVLGMALLVAGDHGLGAQTGAEWAAVLLLGVLTLTEPLLALPEAAIARHRAGRAVARLAALRRLPASTINHPAPENSSATSIVVRGLVAGWDPARPPALDGIDLELPAGGRVAILGASGAGKSTLAAVLTGLLEPSAGTVTGAGIGAGVGRVAMVGDEVDHVFASTVRENLRLSRKDASDDALRAALAEVRLADWLAGLPHGLDSWLGEGGTTMSGGELRRLVTARALLSEPDLLILDEPTEGLDEPTAQALMADLLVATSGRRVLLLTHRTEGLDQVDATYQLRSPGLDLAGDRVGQPGRRRQAQPGGHEQADHLGGQQLGPALDRVLVAQVAVLGGPADH